MVENTLQIQRIRAQRVYEVATTILFFFFNKILGTKRNPFATKALHIGCEFIPHFWV